MKLFILYFIIILSTFSCKKVEPPDLSARIWANKMGIEIKGMSCSNHTFGNVQCIIHSRKDKIYVIMCYEDGECEFTQAMEI